MNTLKIGSTLQGGKYRIERILGQGGFGITYLVRHTILEKDFAIKEFFYKDFCERDADSSHVTLGTTSSRELVERFMAKFLKEARTISSLEHPNIIHIHDIFKENNTAYYVMEYIEGESLAEKVKSQGALPEQEAIGYIKQVASALDFIHQRSINHLDVKPANIMVRSSDNVAVLIDFGLSKQYDAEGTQTSTTPVGISHGYAAIEQYKQGGVSTFSPETDIYALGATLYKLVTGNTPPQPMDILAEGTLSLPNHISTHVGNAINKAMQVRKDDRVKSIAEFLNGLNIFSQDSSFAHKKIKVQRNHDCDEATKIIVDSHTKVVKKQGRTTCNLRPGVSANLSKEANTGNNKMLIVYKTLIIFILVSCILLLIIWVASSKSEHTESMSPESEKISECLKVTNITPTTDLDSKKLAYIDLGLPSGTLWADRNVGAKTPSEYGGLYRWGNPYTDLKGTNVNISSKNNIIGTDDDVAKIKQGKNWRTPTASQFKELLECCQIIYEKIRGRNVAKFVGPNGNFIVLPLTGTMYNFGRSQAGDFGIYNSGELNTEGKSPLSLSIFEKNGGLEVEMADYFGIENGDPVRGVYFYKVKDLQK